MELEYTIITQNRKTVAIQIDDGKVIVKAPPNYPESEIKDFVNKKQKWIQKYLEIAKHKPCFSYEDGSTFHLLGKKYKVRLFYGSIQEYVKKENEYILVYVHSRKENLNKNKKLIEEWIDEQAEKIIRERYDLIFELFDYKNKPPMFIKKFKSRWGAYHRKIHGSYITMNRNLIMYPIECIDYVVAHELAHKKHHNHSKRFYKFLESKYPGWKEHKNILDGKVD